MRDVSTIVRVGDESRAYLPAAVAILDPGRAVVFEGCVNWRELVQTPASQVPCRVGQGHGLLI